MYKLLITAKISALIVLGFFILPITILAQCSGINPDLTTHVNEQIDNRISQTTSSAGLSLFSDYSTDPAFFDTVTQLTWNQNSWTKKGTPLNFTGVAAYLLPSGVPYQGGATLITPKHFVTADHNKPIIGSNITFINSSGNTVTRKVTGYADKIATDIAVGVLDNAVDSSISHYQIIRSGTLSNLLSGTSIPITVVNQTRSVSVRSMAASSVSYNLLAHSTGNKVGFSSDLQSGDSGQPGFLIVENKPLLLFTNYTVGSGSNLGNYITQINQAIDTLGSSGYHITEYNSSCFTDYSTPLPPANSWPFVSTVSPSSGPIGSKITLTGQNFSKTEANSISFTSSSNTFSFSTTSLDGIHLTVNFPSQYNITSGTVFKIWIENDEFGFSDENPSYASNPATFTITVPPPTCSTFTYSEWSTCANNSQSRTVLTSSPSGCTGGSPITTQACTVSPPTCTSFTYSSWGTCNAGQQIRTVLTSSPSGCTGGSPVIVQNCTPVQTVTNQAPTVSAGADRTIEWPTNSVSLVGSISDDSLPTNSTLSKSWSVISGNSNNVSFSCPSCSNTNVIFTSPGTYTLRLYASDSSLSSSDDIVIKVNTASVNNPPANNPPVIPPNVPINNPPVVPPTVNQNNSTNNSSGISSNVTTGNNIPKIDSSSSTDPDDIIMEPAVKPSISGFFTYIIDQVENFFSNILSVFGI